MVRVSPRGEFEDFKRDLPRLYPLSSKCCLMREPGCVLAASQSEGAVFLPSCRANFAAAEER